MVLIYDLLPIENGKVIHTPEYTFFRESINALSETRDNIGHLESPLYKLINEYYREDIDTTIQDKIDIIDEYIEKSEDIIAYINEYIPMLKEYKRQLNDIDVAYSY